MRADMPAGGRRWVAGMQLAVAFLLMLGIWAGLPARYLIVDAIGTGVAMLQALAGVALLSSVAWALWVARIASWAALTIGAATATALSLSAAKLAGMYGPVGSGGALLLGTIALLILPYLVGLPAVQLVLLRRG